MAASTQERQLFERLESFDPDAMIENALIAKEGLERLEEIITVEVQEIEVIQNEIRDLSSKAMNGGLEPEELQELKDLMSHEEKFKYVMESIEDFADSEQGQALRDLLNNADKMEERMDRLERVTAEIREMETQG